MKKVIVIIYAAIVIFGVGYFCSQIAYRYPDQVAERHISAQQERIAYLEDHVHLVRVTAYCPCEKCCGKWADGITASGKPAEGFFVAAPPNIPFGTLISIPGYADGLPVPVLDRGGAIKGNRLDVFFPTHQEALNWGVKYLEVKICDQYAIEAVEKMAKGDKK